MEEQRIWLVNLLIRQSTMINLAWPCFLIPGDVVIHIFLPPQRAFYNLEEFYANATLIELPFENQPPPFRG